MKARAEKRFLDLGDGSRIWRLPGVEFDVTKERFAEIEAQLPGYIAAAAAAAPAGDTPGAGNTKTEIAAWAEAHGIALDGKMTKAQMLAAIEAAR